MHCSGCLVWEPGVNKKDLHLSSHLPYRYLCSIAWFRISLFCLLYTMHTKYFQWKPPQYVDISINSWEWSPYTYRNFSSYWMLFTVWLGRFGCALVKLTCCSRLMAARVTALNSISILFVSLQTYCMYISPLSWLTIIFIILFCSTGIEIRSLQCRTVHKVPLTILVINLSYLQLLVFDV